MQYRPPPPTVTGFQEFIYTYMGITTAQLPPTTPVIEFAFWSAIETVNLFLAGAPLLYNQAVYNLAGDILMNYAPDVVPTVPYGGTKLPFFAFMRQKFNINGFVSGVISSASDEGTGDSLVVPDSLAQLTLADLQNLKTPWGRAYLSIAQKWGPDLFGIT